MDKDTALKLALEAFEWNYNTDLDNIPACEKWAKMLKENIAAIKKVLAQPEQKPVACPFPCGWKRLFEIIVADGAFLARSLEEGEAITEHQREVVMHVIGYAKDMALHGMKATPPQRTWVGLTDEERESFWKADQMTQKEWDELFTAIEAKLREKNGIKEET